MMKKKIVAIIVCLAVVLGSLTGCGGGNSPQKPTSGASGADSNYVTNAKFDEAKMLNLQGEPFLYEDGTILENFGFGFALTEQMQLLVETYQLSTDTVLPDNAQRISFFSESAATLMKEFDENREYTDEEKDAMSARIDGGTGELAGIFRIRENDALSNDCKKYIDKAYAKQEIIGKIGKDTYYFAYNDSFPEVEYSDKDKETLDSLLQEIDWLKQNICVFPLVERPKASMQGVDATTMSDESFTAETLADYSLTMVNVWATWCPPCVSEMPELQKLYEKLPEGVNLISVCDDVESEPELAAEIVAKTGVQYPVLIPNEGLTETLLSTLLALPTTIFVDSEGTIVGEPMVGVPDGDVVEQYLAAINERLAMVK